MRFTGIFTAVGVALALLLSPFSAADVSELLPVQNLRLGMEGQLVCVQTDGGLTGLGATPEAALRNLEETAPGVVIFSTARTLVAEAGAEAALVHLLRMDVLRPGTELLRAYGPIDPADCADYLSRHSVRTTASGAQAALLRGETYPLPVLVGKEGRYRIVE